MTAFEPSSFTSTTATNRSFERLGASLGVDHIELEAARAGLREVVRQIAVGDGLPLESWPDARIDRLLRRLAAWAPGPCPRPLDVIEGCDRDHLRACPRCDRLARLVQSRILEPDQLLPPSIGARPTGRTEVVALQIHRDARGVRRALVEELAVPSFPMGNRVLLIDGQYVDAVHRAVVTAAEVGAPGAEHLRMVHLEGRGRWGQFGLAGSLPERAWHELQERPWGHADGLGPLPEELPEPPSARPWWGLVLLLAAIVGLMLTGLPEPTGEAPPGLEVAFVKARGGVWAHFDVPETAWVTVVAEDPGGLQVVMRSQTAGDKIVYAVGDGTYRLHAPGRGLLLAVHPRPLRDLDGWVAAAAGARNPLQTLADGLREEAEVEFIRR